MADTLAGEGVPTVLCLYFIHLMLALYRETAARRGYSSIQSKHEAADSTVDIVKLDSDYIQGVD